MTARAGRGRWRRGQQAVHTDMRRTLAVHQTPRVGHAPEPSLGDMSRRLDPLSPRVAAEVAPEVDPRHSQLCLCHEARKAAAWLPRIPNSTQHCVKFLWVRVQSAGQSQHDAMHADLKDVLRMTVQRVLPELLTRVSFRALRAQQVILAQARSRRMRLAEG